MNGNAAKTEPAVGQVIPQSRLKTLCVLAGLLGVLVCGIVLMWAWWTETNLPFPIVGARESRWHGVTGGLMASMAALLIVMGIPYLFAREKLVISRDRLQIVQREKVVEQIPFRNIAKLSLADDEGVAFIGIDLKNPDDPETFADGSSFTENKTADGWHYRIRGVYQRGLDEIHRMLLGQIDRADQA